MRRPIRLDLGCGNNKQAGYFGVDIFPGREVDVVANLEIPPLLFLTSSVDEVYVSHFLEHTENPNAVIEDIHRILAPQGALIIKVLHFSNYKGFQPFHKRFFGYTVFMCMIQRPLRDRSGAITPMRGSELSERNCGSLRAGRSPIPFSRLGLLGGSRNFTNAFLPSFRPQMKFMLKCG